MNLIPMTDFVLEQRNKKNTDNIRRFWACEKYAKFLKKHISLKMFEDGDIFFNEKSEFLKETETDLIFFQFGWEKKIPKFFKVEDLTNRGFCLSFNPKLLEAGI